MKTFVIGDIHGANKALVQCLEKASFDKENDTLICLGDVADGWPEVPEAFETLLSIKKLIYIWGNHDAWLFDWLTTKVDNLNWLMQGGQASADAYNKHGDETISRHAKFLNDNRNYYIEKDNNLYIHGGFVRHLAMKDQNTQTLMWDRDLAMTVHHLHQLVKSDMYHLEYVKGIGAYVDIYLGHTTTSWISPKENDFTPLNYFNFWFMDTGGGFEGRLSMMNVKTKELFQSDFTDTLYEEFPGRSY